MDTFASFIYPSMDTWAACTSRLLCMCIYLLSVLLGTCPEVELLGHMVILCFISWGAARLSHSIQGFLFLHILSSTCCFLVFCCFFVIVAILVGARWYSVWFWFAFPSWSVMLSIFSCAHCRQPPFILIISLNSISPSTATFSGSRG